MHQMLKLKKLRLKWDVIGIVQEDVKDHAEEFVRMGVLTAVLVHAKVIVKEGVMVHAKERVVVAAEDTLIN